MIGLPALAISAPLSYLAAFWIPAFDAVLPILPSETVVIALGVATAGSTDPRIGILVLLAAVGAFAGDNLAYLIGRRFSSVAERRFFAGSRGRRRRAWAQRTLDRHGSGLIIMCRFIPGGRTAVTVTCGIVGYQRKRFVLATACAGIIWASYAYFLGRLGGAAFEGRPWAGLLLAFGAAIALSALAEGARRIHARRTRARLPSAPHQATLATPLEDLHPPTAVTAHVPHRVTSATAQFPHPVSSTTIKVPLPRTGN